MHRATLLFLLPFTLAAQGIAVNGTQVTPPSLPAAPPSSIAQPATAPEDLCTIEGQVVNAVTGEPVRKARLNLNRSEPTPGGFPASYTTVTDAAGKFAMKDLEPGKYRLTIDRTGYVNTQYGARGPNRPGTILTLNRGQKLKDVNSRLTPGSVITGRVMDEDGEPVAYAQVQVLQSRYQQGRKQLVVSGGASTNDLGEFRIFSLAPGTYYVMAMNRQDGIEYAVDRSATPQPEEDYVPIYYPGRLDPSAATPLEVTPGSQLGDINFTLSKTHTVRISGRIANMPPAASGSQVMITLARHNAPTNLAFPGRTYSADPVGKFQLHGVAPGSYTLTAFANVSPGRMTARYPLEVGSANIENLTLTLGPGFAVTGSVAVEGNANVDVKAIHVNARPRDALRVGFGGALDADGAFKLQNIQPNLYDLMFSPLPDGFYVKSIRSGTTDILTSGLDVTSGPPEPLQVVLSAKAGQVTGTVQDAKTQQPAPNATVVLIPQDQARRDRGFDYKTANTDQSGNFTVKNLVPGEYKAYAWEDIEPGAWMDPDVVKPVESKGESLSVQEGDRVTIQLTLIPAAQ